MQQQTKKPDRRTKNKKAPLESRAKTQQIKTKTNKIKTVNSITLPSLQNFKSITEASNGVGVDLVPEGLTGSPATKSSGSVKSSISSSTLPSQGTEPKD